ncbi:MAG: hypothetical protein R3D03_07550 [Geminicoccaceae bacterium]
MDDHTAFAARVSTNLKSVIDVDIPRFAGGDHGLSGSGKSSLAFDTIYAEGQRRHVESLGLCPAKFSN